MTSRRRSAGADPEEDVGRGQAELLEEHGRHVGVVVLARVHQDDVEVGVESLEGAMDGCRLHEVGAGPDHEADSRGHASMLAASVTIP